MSTKPTFSRPGGPSWQEDKPDIDVHSSTQFVYNAHHSLALDIQRKRLPIYKNRDHIIYLLEKYQTLVLVGETGCGKSTQLPQVVCFRGKQMTYGFIILFVDDTGTPILKYQFWTSLKTFQTLYTFRGIHIKKLGFRRFNHQQETTTMYKSNAMKENCLK